MAKQKSTGKDDLGHVNREPRAKRKRLNTKGIAILAVILLIVGAGSWYAHQQLNQPQLGASLPIFNEEAEATGQKTIDILLMGMETRGYETVGRTDTMLLLSVRRDDMQAALISVPRDTMVKNDQGNYRKINTLAAADGAESSCRAVSELLNVNVDHYILVNFEGFAAIVDVLGGIDIEVPAAMYHWDPDPALVIDIPAGPNHMDGQTALNYVRFRGTPSADIGRVQRQQDFLKLLFDELVQTKTIKKLPAMMSEVYNYVSTDMTVKEMISLANLAKDFSRDDVVSATLPGDNYYHSSIGSCWKADPEIAPRLVEALLAGESFETWVDSPHSYSYSVSSGDPAPAPAASAAGDDGSPGAIPDYIDIPVLEDDASDPDENAKTPGDRAPFGDDPAEKSPAEAGDSAAGDTDDAADTDDDADTDDATDTDDTAGTGEATDTGKADDDGSGQTDGDSVTPPARDSSDSDSEKKPAPADRSNSDTEKQPTPADSSDSDSEKKPAPADSSNSDSEKKPTPTDSSANDGANSPAPPAQGSDSSAAPTDSADETNAPPPPAPQLPGGLPPPLD